MESDAYEVETEPIYLTIDLYPDVASFSQCNLTKFNYIVGIGEWFDVKCLYDGIVTPNTPCNSG